MLRRASAILLAFLLFVTAAAAAETVRTKSRLNLRQEPSTSSARVALLPPGSTLEVISRRGLWIRVKSGAGEGWVHSEYVVPTELVENDAPQRSLRDAELALEVARLRIQRLEGELAAARGPATSADEALRSQIAERDQRIEQLTQQLAESERDALVAETVPAAEALRQELSLATAARDQLRGELDLAQGALASANQELAATQAASAESAAATELLAEERDAAQATAARLRGELAAAQQAQAAAQTAVAESGTATARLLEERDVAQASVTRLGSQLAAAQQQLQAAQGGQERVTDLEGELAAVSEQLEQRTNALQALEQRLATDRAVAQRQAGAAAELDGLRREHAAVVAARDALTEEKETLAARVSGLDADVEAANQIVQSRDSRIAQLEAAMTRGSVELRAQVDQAATALATRTAERDELGRRLVALEEENETLLRQHAEEATGERQSQARIAELERQLVAAAEVEQQRDAQLRDLTARVEVGDSAQEELEQGQATLASARATLAQRDRELAALRVEFAARTAGITELDGELTAARQELAARGRRVAELEQELATARDLEQRRVAQLRDVSARVEAGDGQQEELAQSQAALASAREALVQRDTELAGLRSELRARSAGASAMSDELEAARQDLAERDRRMGELEQQLTAVAERVSGEHDSWAQQIASAEADGALFAARALELEETLRSLDQQLQGLEQIQSAAGDDRSQRLQEVMAERDSARRDQTELRRELAAAQTARQESVERSSAMEAEARRLAAALLELEAWSDEAEVVVGNLTAEKTALEQEVTSLKSRRERRDAPRAAELRDAEARASQAERSVDSLETQLEEARQQLAAAQAGEGDAVARSSQELEVTKALLAKAREEVDAESRRAAVATEATARLEARLERIAESQAGSQTARAAALRELEQAAAQSDSLRADVLRLTEVERDLRARVGRLEPTAEAATTWRRRAETAAAELAAARREAVELSAALERVRAAQPRMAPAEPVAEAEVARADARAPSPEEPGATSMVAAEPLAVAPLVAPAEPVVETPREPVIEPVIEPSVAAVAAVRTWAEAWSNQDVNGYLSLYDTTFVPANAVSRTSWEAQRRQRLSRPAFIEIALDDLEAQAMAADRVAVTFSQAYRSNTFSDRVSKRLELVRRDNGWKIVREVSR